ncbi:beta-1,3-galactosyltransferase 1-like [Ptychodera flava]|uniref:beta-1,3-galactosyltransferase 1-like n=1 Tax=Ptychodera flava TaxID=63121 RepID=UPI003969C214
MRGYTALVCLSVVNLLLWFVLFKRSSHPMSATKASSPISAADSPRELKAGGPTQAALNVTSTNAGPTSEANITNYLTGHLINPHNYGYVLNVPGACKNKQVFLLVLVTAHTKSLKAREAIRNSWASVKEVEGKKIVTLFLLGVDNANSKHLQNSVVAENGVHRDILQEDFVDNYLNMTLKTIMGLKWVKTYCPHAEYVMKTDSDMFVNYRGLINYIFKQPRLRYALGYRFDGAKPERRKNKKWYTPLDLYSDPTYPPYLCGTGYIMSTDVAVAIYDISLQIRYLSWEDVFVGIGMQQIGIIPHPEERFDTFAVLYKRKLRCPLHSIFTIHGITPSRMRHIWGQYKREDAYRTCRAA